MCAKTLAVLLSLLVGLPAFAQTEPEKVIRIIIEIRIVVVPQPGPSPPNPPDPTPPKPPEPDAALVRAIADAATIDSYTGLDGLTTGFKMCAKSVMTTATAAKLQQTVKDTLASVTPLRAKLHALLSKELNDNLPKDPAKELTFADRERIAAFFERLALACEAARTNANLGPRPRAGIEESSDKDN